MALTASDLLHDAGLWHRVYPHWPHAEPDGEPAGQLAEVTIGWGEDTNCAVCLCLLPAGAPAWEDRDGVLCADDAAAEGAAA